MKIKGPDPIVTYEQANGKKLKGAALDKEIKSTFKDLWKYDNNCSFSHLTGYIAKYFKVSHKHVISLVEGLV